MRVRKLPRGTLNGQSMGTLPRTLPLPWPARNGKRSPSTQEWPTRPLSRTWPARNRRHEILGNRRRILVHRAHAQSSLSSADGLGESIVSNDDRLQRRLEPPCDQSENLGPHPGVGFDHGALDGGVQMGLDEFADDGIEHMP
jgi:hypothetical protein